MSTHFEMAGLTSIQVGPGLDRVDPYRSWEGPTGPTGPTYILDKWNVPPTGTKTAPQRPYEKSGQNGWPGWTRWTNPYAVTVYGRRVFQSRWTRVDPLDPPMVGWRVWMEGSRYGEIGGKGRGQRG